MIRLQGFEIRSPDGKLLLENLSIELMAGERLAFFGPNGCGKSTLLRYLAGLEPQNYANKTDWPFGKAAYLPTRPLDLLLPWASVLDNIRLFGRLAERNGGTRQSQILTDTNVKNSLGYEIEALHNMRTYNLSSGQQAILAIHCALQQQAALLIADEIFATLSENLRLCVATYLKNLEIAIICASHDSRFYQLPRR